MNKYEFVNKICTTVLANVKANFKLNGYDLKYVPYVGSSTARIFFDVKEVTGYTNTMAIPIKLDKTREELIIMDLCYKLLLWLNDLTFDKRCNESYTIEGLKIKE